MKTLLRRATAMIAIIALAVTLLPPSALAEAKTSFVRSQIDSRSAKLYSEASAEIETVPHKTENPKRSEIWDGSIATGFAGGSGTQEDPYLISNGSELAYLAQEVNDNDNSYSGVYFKLMNDIYLNDTSDWESWGDDVAPQNEWTATGVYNALEDDSRISFNGCFDGDGYAVRGIYINNQETLVENHGLFGYIGDGSIIANLGVAESYIYGKALVGGVVGLNQGGTVTNCYNTGSISGLTCISGLVGSNEAGTITNCYNTGNVIGETDVGGVVGQHIGGIVSDCYNIGIISGERFYIGGVIGWSCGSVIDCHNSGSVSGEEDTGGVVGESFSWHDGLSVIFYPATVIGCYNTGSVTGKEGSGIGGVVGTNTTIYDSVFDANYNATVTNCYNIGSVNGSTDVGGVVGENVGTVTDCFNTGNISGEEDSIGGVIGRSHGWYNEEADVYDNANVSNCYNTGSISGYNRVGGVVGENACTVTDCYNVGSVIGKDVIGGIVGADIIFYDEEIDVYYEGIVTDCYNIGNVIGETDVGGAVGAMFGPYDDDNVTNCYYLNTCCANGNEYGTALTDQQMQASDSFVGFDFVEVWTMDGNPDYSYPELASNIHEGTPGATTEPGDANGDGRITIADATLISRMALNLTESVPAADFNGDGNINIADATLTARKALNLI